MDQEFLIRLIKALALGAVILAVPLVITFIIVFAAIRTFMPG